MRDFEHFHVEFVWPLGGRASATLVVDDEEDDPPETVDQTMQIIIETHDWKRYILEMADGTFSEYESLYLRDKLVQYELAHH